VNKDYLEIAIKEDINDFRSKTEIRYKITEIRINRVLLNLFKKSGLTDYFEN
jgi:hypothetical protein